MLSKSATAEPACRSIKATPSPSLFSCRANGASPKVDSMLHTASAALVPLLLTAFLPPMDVTESTGSDSDSLEIPFDTTGATRLRTPVDSYTDIDMLTEAQRDGIPPLPADAVGIGPGSPLLVTIPNEGTFICTANYLFTSGGRTYLGAAGHCFLPESKKATHGSGADYNPSGVVTEVCVDFCVFGGQLTGILGDFRTLG